jgi:hypothetical protein
MSFTPSFSASQLAGDLSTIRLTDDSSGSDVLITSRQVYIRTATGTYLVPTGNASDQYIEWSYGSSTIDIDVLTQDFAPQIIVLWLNVAGVTLYTKEIAYSFTGYSEEFYYELTQGQAGDPDSLRDTPYWQNKIKLRVLIDSANQAISWASDTSAAQNCLNLAQYMIDNESLYF